MMKRFLFFLLLFEFSYFSFAQNPCYIRLIDAVSMKPVSNAAYVITDIKKNGISDSLGLIKFELNSRENLQLEILHLNYEDNVTILKASDAIKDTFYVYLVPKINKLDEVVITAFKDREKRLRVPANVDVITGKEIKQKAMSSIDDALDNLSGVNVDRPFGIFGEANVNIRGIGGNEPARQLVLLDGVPIISDDRAVVNWNSINPESIQKIEVLKGPNSALYGSNAMGGVIQLFTKRQQIPGNSAIISSEYGAYNTFSNNVFISGKPKKTFNKIDWRIFGGYRRSDGYIARPDSLIDSTDVKKSFWEYNINTGINYQVNNNTHVFFNAGYYENIRNRGLRIFEEDGTYFKSNITSLTGGIRWEKEKHDLSFSVYLQKETDRIQVEMFIMPPANVNNGLPPSPLYLKQSNFITKEQKGFNTTYTYKSNKQTFTISADLNNFTVLNEDNSDKLNDPDPSTDQAQLKGNRLNGNLYIQDRINLLNNKLFLIPGLNLHYENYLNGSYNVINPSPNNTFMLDYTTDLNDTLYIFLAPRLSALYNFNDKTSVYVSYSRGYRTATFEDLLRSGLSREGFITPNPGLVPEKLDNYELGIKFRPIQNLSYSITLFHATGNNFMYFVETGQYINNGRDPILRKENFTSVSNTGIETEFNYNFSVNFKTYVNYTFNKSIIHDFAGNDQLVGKLLTYTPKHSVSTGAVIETKYANLSVNALYRSEMFMDHYNAQVIDDMLTADAKIWREFNQRYNIYFMVQNIFNQQYLAMGNQLSIGRFMAFGINVKID